MYDAMKFFCSVTKDEINLEKSIKLMLQLEFGFDVCKFFPYIMYTVRSKQGETRWQSGFWVEELGYYIKYPGEFQRATYHEKIITEPNDWYKIVRTA